MMNVCEESHEAITFEGYDCPLCAALIAIARLRDDLETAKEESEDE